ncbi:MAG: hypothetical protein GY913_17395 [Proteobacteria bacterium]|nr:hypothetical protein [Pseudomonadota bacterium]MCP4918682.1 hypothetical protein [Pseudomonadota bacterium]
MRAKVFACDDELPGGASARRGDLVLQNALVTAVIRSPGESLTVLHAPGGGLVDFAPWNGQDWLWEAQPLVDGEWLVIDEVELGDDDGAWIRLAGPDGEVTWRLPADSRSIELTGADLWLHGDRRSEALAGGFLRGTNMLVSDGQVEDLGGAQLVTGLTALTVGSLEDVHDALWDTPAQGSCDADRVDVWLDGERTGVLPATFDSHAPLGAELVCAGAGRVDGEPVPAATGLELAAGEAGSIRLRVADEDGHEIPVVLTVDGHETAVSDRFEPVPTGAGTFSVVVDAGPRFTTWEGELEVLDEVGLEVVLDRRYDPVDHVLVDLFQAPFPSATTRLEQNDALELSAARGVAFVVQAPPDEVGRPYQSDWTERTTRAIAGSETRSDVGSVWSWPWSANDKHAGHGAGRWLDRDANAVLAIAGGYGDPDRVTVVDVAWVENAGLVAAWPEDPDALRLESLDDLDVLFELLDAEVRIAVTGPLTWVPADDTLGPPSQSAIERGLVEGTSIASTGPFVELDTVLFPELAWEVSDGEVELWVDGALADPDAPVTAERWAIAVLRDGDDWAVSAPLWF